MEESEVKIRVGNKVMTREEFFKEHEKEHQKMAEQPFPDKIERLKALQRLSRYFKKRGKG